jgi:ribonuclease HI
MAWTRMQWKGQTVFVRVDDHGKPVLDGSGRAEMKYREDDVRVYRPSASNLGRAQGDPAGSSRAASARSQATAAAAHRGENRSAAEVQPGPTERIDVWTDGACSGNPGPMGIGVVVLADGQRREHGEYLGVGTNNIAELVAIERGVEMAAENGADRGRPIHVYSDSGYAIGVLSKGWKAKANQELVARVRRALAGRPVRMVKVPGHAGVPENERCDELARDAILSRGRV